MVSPVSETRRFSQDQVGSLNRLTRYREQFTSKTGITATGAVLLSIAVLSWVIARIAGGRPLYMLSYGLFGVFIIALILGRRPLPLTGDRSESRPRLAEGETITIDVALTAKRRLSTFILEEQVPRLLGSPARVPIASIEEGDSVGHNYKLTLTRRGAYSLGPLIARSGDPLGFTQKEQVLCEPYEVLVHPSIEVVQDRPLTRMFEDPPIRPPISKPWPTGMEFYGMREYQPGDDLRRIVWRAYARTGKLLVRESEQGITDKITLVVDQNRRAHSKGVVSESFEAGIKAAASLGIRHLREGYAVTLEGNSKRVAGPLRGGNSQMMLLDALARFELQSETLTDPITRMIANPSRDNHIVILTPHLDSATAARLRLLVERGASVLVAALIWSDEGYETLGTAAGLGCQIVEIRPGAPLAVAFRREVGAGRL
jgi:uncharacterized protein (DUF58 family)